MGDKWLLELENQSTSPSLEGVGTGKSVILVASAWPSLVTIASEDKSRPLVS